MGIKKFRKQFLSTLPSGYGQSKEWRYYKGAVHHLLIDMNSELHKVAGRVYGYDEQLTRSEAERRLRIIKGMTLEETLPIYREELFKVLDGTINIVNPTTTVVMAVDGVAPAAKISQQRTRRYSPGAFSNEPMTAFSPIMITPGTEFMVHVDEMLNEYVSTCTEVTRNLNFIYSSYRSYGEGEQKMFHIAEEIYEKIKDKNEVFATIGADSDIISLSILRPFKTLMITVSMSGVWEYIDANEVKRYAVSKLNARDMPLDQNLVVKDFVLMIFLVGNDFVPKVPMSSNVLDMINICIESHKRLRTTITTRDNNINWSAFADLILGVSRYEVNRLMAMTRMAYKYPHPVFHSRDAVQFAEHHDEESYKRLIKKEYYRKTIIPQSAIGQKLLGIDPLSSNFSEIEEDELDLMVYDWCSAILWVLRYYTTRTAPAGYIYERIYTPLLTDVAERLKTMRVMAPSTTNLIMNSNGFLGQTGQLLSVIPPKHFNMIPKNVSGLLHNELAHIAPVDFELRADGIENDKDAQHMKTTILPIISPKMIMDLLLTRGIDEKMCNLKKIIRPC